MPCNAAPADVPSADEDWLLVSPVKHPKLRVLTWNIWFQPVEVQARMAAVAACIKQEQPDIVALQEVTKELEEALLEHAVLRDYVEVPAPRSPHARYYTLLLAMRSTCRWRAGHREPFQYSRHARDRLAGELEWCGLTLQVTNVHLESPDAKAWGPDDMGSAERHRQLNIVLDNMSHKSDSLILGDFNWIPVDGSLPVLPPGTVDAWTSLHSRQPGLTYDKDRNGCVRSNHCGRPDRVICKQRWLRVAASRMVGTKALRDAKQPSGRAVMPSDHFGLVADFSVASEPLAEADWTCESATEVMLAELEANTAQPGPGWTCEVCGFQNREKNLMCGGTGGLGCKTPRPGNKVANQASWFCMCGFQNRATNLVCGGVGGALGCKMPMPLYPFFVQHQVLTSH
eukprot:TRINITY_DN30670_c0_g1_i1.p1 TRINITY_DN30670_c0_g1~~TRINITY_DN30670_c0_g1_i1.p1  ORF type:complete len:399 (+),score=67.59 TRINITY_DN30670_c0_g1_i1:77-1273(+)